MAEDLGLEIEAMLEDALQEEEEEKKEKEKYDHIQLYLQQPQCYPLFSHPFNLKKPKPNYRKQTVYPDIAPHRKRSQKLMLEFVDRQYQTQHQVRIQQFLHAQQLLYQQIQDKELLEQKKTQDYQQHQLTWLQLQPSTTCIADAVQHLFQGYHLFCNLPNQQTHTAILLQRYEWFEPVLSRLIQEWPLMELLSYELQHQLPDLSESLSEKSESTLLLSLRDLIQVNWIIKCWQRWHLTDKQSPDLLLSCKIRWLHILLQWSDVSLIESVPPLYIVPILTRVKTVGGEILSTCQGNDLLRRELAWFTQSSSSLSKLHLLFTHSYFTWIHPDIFDLCWRWVQMGNYASVDYLLQWLHQPRAPFTTLAHRLFFPNNNRPHLLLAAAQNTDEIFARVAAASIALWRPRLVVDNNKRLDDIVTWFQGPIVQNTNLLFSALQSTTSSPCLKLDWCMRQLTRPAWVQFVQETNANGDQITHEIVRYIQRSDHQDIQSLFGLVYDVASSLSWTRGKNNQGQTAVDVLFGFWQPQHVPLLFDILVMESKLDLQKSSSNLFTFLTPPLQRWSAPATHLSYGRFLYYGLVALALTAETQYPIWAQALVDPLLTQPDIIQQLYQWLQDSTTRNVTVGNDVTLQCLAAMLLTRQDSIFTSFFSWEKRSASGSGDGLWWLTQLLTQHKSRFWHYYQQWSKRPWIALSLQKSTRYLLFLLHRFCTTIFLDVVMDFELSDPSDWELLCLETHTDQHRQIVQGEYQKLYPGCGPVGCGPVGTKAPPLTVR